MDVFYNNTSGEKSRQSKIKSDKICQVHYACKYFLVDDAYIGSL